MRFTDISREKVEEKVLLTCFRNIKSFPHLFDFIPQLKAEHLLLMAFISKNRMLVQGDIYVKGR